MAYKTFTVDGLGTVTIYKRRNNRSIRLTVEADGEIRMTMPLWVPYRAGVAFASARRAWIMTQSQHHTAGSILRHGQAIGKAHHLILRYDPAATNIRTNVRSIEVIVTYGPKHAASDEAVQTAARSACIRALRSESNTLLLQRLRQLAMLHNVDYRSGNIKRLKSRWGSCDQQKNIVLNLYLIQLPWECVDYVILHELTHTRVLHHGPDFWQEFESLEPRARQLRKAMRAYRPTLFAAS